MHPGWRRRKRSARDCSIPSSRAPGSTAKRASPTPPTRTESLEHRFKYTARFDKLLRRPQAPEVLDILRLYAATCIPIPRTTERFYWSVSCLPSTSDKPLARVNASWMELFTLLPDGEDLRARFILHLSDFTTDGSPEPDHLDHALLERCVERPEDVSHFLWKADTFGVKVRTAASIRAFLAHPTRAAPSAASTSPT